MPRDADLLITRARLEQCVARPLLPRLAARALDHPHAAQRSRSNSPRPAPPARPIPVAGGGRGCWSSAASSTWCSMCPRPTAPAMAARSRRIASSSGCRPAIRSWAAAQRRDSTITELAYVAQFDPGRLVSALAAGPGDRRGCRALAAGALSIACGLKEPAHATPECHGRRAQRPRRCGSGSAIRGAPALGARPGSGRPTRAPSAVASRYRAPATGVPRCISADTHWGQPRSLRAR
jgi:hypothetical protein